jgi:hypothetical protein
VCTAIRVVQLLYRLVDGALPLILKVPGLWCNNSPPEQHGVHFSMLHLRDYYVERFSLSWMSRNVRKEVRCIGSLCLVVVKVGNTKDITHPQRALCHP